MRFVIRLLINAAALWVAVALVPGLIYEGDWLGLVGVALVFGIVNAVIRPIILWFTCPLVLLTLGLFVLVLNGLMLWLAALLSGALGITFIVANFWAAFLGALVVGIVSTALTIVVGKRRTRG
jgi:putative membrane protein